MSENPSDVGAGISEAEAHLIYEAINFRDDEWTPGATAVVDRIIAKRMVRAWEEGYNSGTWDQSEGYQRTSNPYRSVKP